MDNAIRLAIGKGGLLGERKTRITKGYLFADRQDAVKWDRWSFNDLVLMSVFWRALGKALGWGKYIEDEYGIGQESWIWYAHRYLDAHFHDDTEKFWKELLKGKQ